MNQDTYSVYTDGASRGNPGPSAAAFVIFKNEQTIHEEANILAPTTNNTAEYTALLDAATWLAKNTSQANVSFFSDSELMVKQLKGIYKIKESHLRELANQINQQLSNLQNWTINHVPRNQNKRADYLCNQALDAQQ